MELRSKNETHFCFRQANYKYCAGNSRGFNASIIWGTGMEFSTQITVLVVFSGVGMERGMGIGRNGRCMIWNS